MIRAFTVAAREQEEPWNLFILYIPVAARMEGDDVLNIMIPSKPERVAVPSFVMFMIDLLSLPRQVA